MSRVMLRSQFTGFSDRQSPFTVNIAMLSQFTVNCLFTDHEQLKMSITNHKELKMPITCHENKYIYPTTNPCSTFNTQWFKICTSIFANHINYRPLCSKYGFYFIMSEGIIDLHHIIGLLVLRKKYFNSHKKKYFNLRK